MSEQLRSDFRDLEVWKNGYVKYLRTRKDKE